MNRTVLLFFGLVAAAGVWIAYHWDDVREKLGVDDPADVQAIELAKSEYSLERLRTNSEVLREFGEGDEEIQILGWRAEQRTETVFLVRYAYRIEGETDAFTFEVNLDSLAVRHVDPDPDLAAKYGVPVRPN